MFITKEQLQQYTNVLPDDTDTMQNVYCSAACGIVADYLGYSPESTDYTQVFDGTGNKRLQLAALPVTEIKSVKADGRAEDATAFTAQDRYLSVRTAEFSRPASGTLCFLLRRLGKCAGDNHHDSAPYRRAPADGIGKQHRDHVKDIRRRRGQNVL